MVGILRRPDRAKCPRDPRPFIISTTGDTHVTTRRELLGACAATALLAACATTPPSMEDKP
ncbi:MAG: twin-arginine translocation signal domain-containing protein, partial [Ramlibacter sp.]